MPDNEQRPLFLLERKLGCTWQHLRKAESEASVAYEELVIILERGIGKFATEDANLVVFGSLARREWIDWSSDLDWTYLIDGQANSRHLKITQQIRSTLEKAGRTVDGRFEP